jgi:hypothetical protein
MPEQVMCPHWHKSRRSLTTSNQKREKQKKSTTRTGGGPSEYTDIDPVTDVVLEIINMKTVTGFNNPWDCDRDLEESISSNVSHKFTLSYSVCTVITAGNNSNSGIKSNCNHSPIEDCQG